MDYKNIWDSIGKFYTANLSLLISALIVWDTNLLDLIPQIANIGLHPKLHINIEPYPILILLGVFGLLAYFIIDWLDANIVSSIDDKVKITDIIFWLTAPIFLSFTLTILLKKSVESYKWLYIGFDLYILYNAIILLFRNRLIYEETSESLFGKERKKYDKLRNIQICDKVFGYIYLVFFVAANFVLLYFQITIKKCELWILGLFVITIILNTFLKWRRFKHVNYYMYTIKKNKQTH